MFVIVARARCVRCSPLKPKLRCGCRVGQRLHNEVAANVDAEPDRLSRTATADEASCVTRSPGPLGPNRVCAGPRSACATVQRTRPRHGARSGSTVCLPTGVTTCVRQRAAAASQRGGGGARQVPCSPAHALWTSHRISRHCAAKLLGSASPEQQRHCVPRLALARALRHHARDTLRRGL